MDDPDWDLVELWARLDRLKAGIGGWVVIAASVPPYSPEAIEADHAIRDLTGTALEVRAQIAVLTPRRPGEEAGEEPGETVAPEGSPLSPATGIPALDWDELMAGPAGEARGAHRQNGDRPASK